MWKTQKVKIKYILIHFFTVFKFIFYLLKLNIIFYKINKKHII